VWSQKAEETVRRIMADQPPVDPWVKYQADRLGALFAGWDLWSCWFLRPSGEVVVVSEDLDKPESESVYRDRRHLLSALSGASRLHPELSELLPTREPGAIDCLCAEHPQLFGLGKIICQDCGGLGWLPSQRPA
jgi:hypothetical protein